MADFYKIVDKTFDFEGGYQSYSNDTANYCGGNLIGTNHGISASAYQAYYGKCPTVSEMKALTKDQAKKIYKAKFWDVIKGDLINNQSVAHIFFDAFIASGSYGMKRIKTYINKYYGENKVAVNSNAITSNEIALINAADAYKLFSIAKQGEIENRNSLATTNPAKYGMFLKGWLNRLNKITFDGINTIKQNPAIIIIFAAIAMLLTYFTIQTLKA